MNITPAICDSVNMRVHADAGDAEPKCDDQVGGFATNTGEFKEAFEVGGDAPIIFLHEDGANLFDVFCLCVVKSDGVNDFCNLLLREVEHILRRAGKGEEAHRCGGCAVILRPEAQHG